MIAFLIKSTLSLIVFLLFYKLILEKEKMHKINRILLLFALVFSVVIPFVSFELINLNENSIVKQAIPSYVLPEIQIGNQVQETEATKSFISYNFLWIIYGIGLLVFLFRFVRNLTSLLSNIHKSEKVRKDGFTLVLIQNEMLPHSFWKYVFVNKNQYENNQIDNELFIHEKAHITQKHSLDILFVEVLQMIFWFNPIIYLYKKAIKLNHEFLADQKVNETFREVIHYQKLLLQKAIGNSLVPIASNLNYSVTKKRFIMMTKSKNNFRIALKTIFSIMVFSVLFMSCSENKSFNVNEIQLTEQERTELLKNIKDKNPKNLTEQEWNALYQEYKERVSNTKVVLEDSEATDKDGNPIEILPISEQDKIYTSVEVMPEYPGGDDRFREFIMKNFKAPKTNVSLEGTIFVTFVVEKDGSLSNVKTVRDLGYGTGEEAVRVVKISKKWKPGIQNGEKVRVKYTLPIGLNISSKSGLEK